MPLKARPLPRPDPATLTEAFSIVRQLLADGPRPFQDILRAGIAAVPGSGPSSASASDGVNAAEAPVAEGSQGKSANAKGKGKERPLVARQRKAELARGQNVVPEGHPFISAK